MSQNQFGFLAAQFDGPKLPIEVLESSAGFYLGTQEHDEYCGFSVPYSRESVEYFPTFEVAQNALDSGNWTQRLEP